MTAYKDIPSVEKSALNLEVTDWFLDEEHSKEQHVTICVLDGPLLRTTDTLVRRWTEELETKGRSLTIYIVEMDLKTHRQQTRTLTASKYHKVLVHLVHGNIADWLAKNSSKVRFVYMDLMCARLTLGMVASVTKWMQVPSMDGYRSLIVTLSMRNADSDTRERDMSTLATKGWYLNMRYGYSRNKKGCPMIVYFYSTLDVEYGYRPCKVIMNTSDESKGLFTVAWYGSKGTTVEDIKTSSPAMLRFLEKNTNKKRKLNDQANSSRPKRSKQLISSTLVDFRWNALSASKANVEFIETQLELLKQRLAQTQSVE